MLVPSMTLAELKNEIEKDYPIVFRKGVYLMENLKKISRKTHVDNIVRSYDYYSKYKNNWIIRVESFKKGGYMGYMAYYYGNQGLVAIIKLQNDDYIAYHTAHFFKRYNERLHLNLTMPKDIIRTYLDESPAWMIQELDQFAPGLRKIYVSTRNGYGLGTLDENQKFYKMNTFITRDMLRGDQVDKAKLLDGYLRKYIPEAENLL